MRKFKKKIQCMILASVMALTSFGMVNAEENNSLCLYVDMHAEVSGNGGVDSPFKTVFEAQEAVREIIAKGEYPEGGITVFLREGQYVLDKTLSFDSRDSGTVEAPVTWRAYYNEDVTITTGSSIPFSEFSVSDDERIRDEVKGKVYSINLTENGYPVHDGLFMNGSAQYYFWQWGMCEPGEPWRGSPNPKVIMGDTEGVLARYPNSGYLKTGKVLTNGNVDDGLWYEGNVGHKIEGEIRGFIMEFDDDRIENWGNAKDAWLYGIFVYDWDTYQVKVETIDVENRTIETTHPYRMKLKEGRESWYILNLLEELDAPGEWYCDTETGYMYIYPPEGLKKDEKISLSFKKMDNLSFDGAKNITVRDITLTSTRADCLKVANSDNLKFQYLEFCYTAGPAMEIDGTNISVSGCYIHNLAKLGSISGHGGDNYNDLIPNGNIVENCWIHDITGALSLGGVGTIFRNNLIHDASGSILTIAGNDALIERNEVHNVMKHTSDAGAFYSVDHVTLCGNVIRDNVFHDMTLNMTGTSESVHAIYLDNYTSGWTITNNVVYNVDGFGVFINMGHANTVTDNIFVNTRRGVYANMGRFDASNVETTGAKALEEEHLTNKAWEKYPHIKEMTEQNWWHGRMNYVADNLCYNVQEEPMKVSYLNVAAAKINERNTFKEGLTTSNPNEFVAAERNNYTLKEDSSIGEKLPNLKNIDMSKASTVTSQIRRAIGDNAICFLKGSPLAYVNFNKNLINEKNIGVTAFTEDDATYVPLRFIKEQKNGQIEWNNGEILVDFDGEELKFYPRSTEYYSNSVKSRLQKPIILIDGTSYISAADYADIFGVTVTEFENGLVILAEKDLTETFDEYMLKDLYERLK